MTNSLIRKPNNFLICLLEGANLLTLRSIIAKIYGSQCVYTVVSVINLNNILQEGHLKPF